MSDLIVLGINNSLVATHNVTRFNPEFQPSVFSFLFLAVHVTLQADEEFKFGQTESPA
jgi:hypothetical protein